MGRAPAFLLATSQVTIIHACMEGWLFGDCRTSKGFALRWTTMTAYEIITIFIGILALLMSFGSLMIALLAFLKNEKSSGNSRRK